MIDQVLARAKAQAELDKIVDMNPVAGDKVHWYDANGFPVWQITGKNGKQRAPFAREAIAMGCVPGVTTIGKQIASFGLIKYFKKQAIMSALTMPRKNGENDDEYIDRILVESEEHSKLRRDDGTELHQAIDMHVIGQAYDTKWQPHIDALTQALAMHGYDLKQGKPQVTFAASRYGGTIDLLFPDAIWDWKTKDVVDPGKKMAYDEQGMQLVAYDYGLPAAEPRKLFNVFVGCKDALVQVHEWNDDKERARLWSKFTHLCAYWWVDKDKR